MSLVNNTDRSLAGTIAAWIDCCKTAHTDCWIRPYLLADLNSLCVYLQDVFQVDFVLIDQRTSIVDNNRGQDFKMLLDGALTENEILRRNAAKLAELEQTRNKVCRHANATLTI